jgi:hypothetical protein
MDENFKLGTEFEAELSPDGKNLRYDYLTATVAGQRTIVDYGPSGNIIKAVVSKITNNVCRISFPDIGDEFGIPLKGHLDYRENQWTLPGFPIPISSRKTESAKCNCGTWSTYGKGVGKGGGHSSWCDIERA